MKGLEIRPAIEGLTFSMGGTLPHPTVACSGQTLRGAVCGQRSALRQVLEAGLLVLGSAMVEAESERKKKSGVPEYPA